MTTPVLRLTIRYAFPQVPCNLVVTLVKYQDTPPHQAHMSHELLGGAAAFEVCSSPLFIITNGLTDIFQAAKGYEKHCAENGKPQSHAKAKELLYILFRVCLAYVYTHL